MRPAAPKAIRLAICDTDDDFVVAVATSCARSGWYLSRLTGRTIAPELLAEAKLNVLLLDPSTPEVGGWEGLSRICMLVPQLPIMVCTSRSSVAERVRALRVGVDDWVTKPLDAEELSARVESVARTRYPDLRPPSGDPVRAGALELRPIERRIFAGGVPFELTAREFDVLHLFARERGRVLGRVNIYERVWGHTMRRGDRSVDSFVGRLRQKLKQQSPGWNYIHTYHRLGYRFDPERSMSPVGPALAGHVHESTR